MNVTLRQLQTFRVVAELGSFSRAGERLNLAQSAISVLVRDLEAELKVRLFDRTTRRVELTETGREFLAHADKLILDLDHAVRHVHELAEQKRGRIAVAAPPLLAATLLPAAIADYRTGFPGVRVTLTEGRTDQIAARVRSGEADFGIGTFAPEEHGLDRRPVVQDELMLFCRRGVRVPHPLRWEDLQGQDLIALTRDSGIRALVDFRLQAAGVTAAPAFEVSQITTALALVEAGLGVSVLPAYALAFPGFRRVTSRPVQPVQTRPIEAILRQGRSLQPAAEAFLGRLQAMAGRLLPR